MIQPLSWAEPVTLAVVLTYFGVQKYYFADRFTNFIRSYALLVPAAWVCEDSVIRAYGFYAYTPGWKVLLDVTPVMVALIWPIVILSARTLASHIGRVWVVSQILIAAGLVVADAALMEAIATSTGLWSWSVPGPFGVPLMGVWGWGCFAVASLWVVNWLEKRPQLGFGVQLVVVCGATLVLTHGLLLISWWSAFRWVPGFPSEWVCAITAVTLGLALGGAAWRLRRRLAVPVPELGSRALAAVYFFVLLFVYNSANTPLLVFAFAFAPPYLALFSVPAGSTENLQQP